MITMEFRDALVNNRFSYYNEYNYIEIQGTNIHYKKTEEEVPFIMTAVNSIDKKLIHDGELMFSKYNNQLRGRSMTTNRIKEVLNSSRFPLIFKIGTHKYLIGKGFLARYGGPGSIDVLFLAVGKRDVKDIYNVKFYISRNIYSPINKKIQPVIKDFMALHLGDIVITSNIEKFVGSKINIPFFKTLSDADKFHKRMIANCVKEFAETVFPTTVEFIPEDPKKKKKEKEAEILQTIRQNPILEALVMDRPTVWSSSGPTPELVTVTTSVESMAALAFEEAVRDAIAEHNIEEFEATGHSD